MLIRQRKSEQRQSHGRQRLGGEGKKEEEIGICVNVRCREFFAFKFTDAESYLR